jgi:signal transduction histidine kinase/CheY-like chemotaxis protein
MNIRTRLLVLVLSILIPSLIAASVALWFVYDAQQDAQQKSMTETAGAIALLVDNELQTSEAILRTLATSKAIAEDDFQAFYEQARRMAPPEYSTIIIADPAGRQLLNTRVPFGQPLPAGKSNLMELRREAGPGKTVISDIFFAPVGKRYDFAIQIPVMRDNQVRYYLQMGIAAQRMQPLVERINLQSGWINVLVDRAGNVLARSVNVEKHIGKPVREALRKRILAGEQSGMHYGVTLDGVPTAAFFSRAPMSGWTVIVNLPLAEMRRPAVHAAMLLGGLILVLLGASVAAARWYARKTSDPIEKLRQAAESLGRGEPVSATPSGLLEIDAVSYSLANASNEIRHSKEALERRVAEAVASAERAQRALLQSQKLEALGRLTAGIAHDFNNILQTLSTALQLIRLTPDPARIQSLAETCEKAVERATTLTGQMRSFGKAQDATLETIDPAKSIQTAMPLLKNALPRNIELNVQVEEGIWPVTVDPLQFELSLLNIVINARDAMQQGGLVSMALCNVAAGEQDEILAAGEYIRISIADNGTGMTPEVLSRALEPFFTTKGIDTGTGLGLPQAYGFAVQSGGKLLLDSKEGQGTTVTIYLPRARTQPAFEAGKALTRRKTQRTGALLFVEDDALVREAVVPAFAQAGFDVAVAENAHQALSILESGRAVDLVFSDIVMPGSISGVELARIVQTRFPGTPVVLATGYSDKQVDVAGVHLLAKPYDINEAIELLSTVT